MLRKTLTRQACIHPVLAGLARHMCVSSGAPPALAARAARFSSRLTSSARFACLVRLVFHACQLASQKPRFFSTAG